MMLHATFADYTRAKYGWDQKHTGYGMAFSGALSVVVDMIILPRCAFASTLSMDLPCISHVSPGLD